MTFRLCILLHVVKDRLFSKLSQQKLRNLDFATQLREAFGTEHGILHQKGNIMTQQIIILDEINITPLMRASASFKQAIKQTQSQLEKDGAIQRFEFTYELVTKIVQKRFLALYQILIMNFLK